MPGPSQDAKVKPVAVAGPMNATVPRPLLESLVDRLMAPISIAPLVYFRIAFAATLLWLISLFFNYKGVDLIARYYIDPPFNFKYCGFGWIQPLAGRGMYVLFFGLGLAAAMIGAGLLYRFAAAAFCVGFTYVFLIERARYMNHYYLICLVSFLLIFIPAHRAFSLDALMRPSLRLATVPAWTLWLLRAQFGLVYFFAGLAKCHADWLNGTIMQMKLGRKTDFPLIGSLFTHDWVPVAFSWGGLLLDLLVFPLLLWKPTRIPALVAAIGFHVLNARLFNIDIFPWMMIAATVILFVPDWLPWFKSNAAASKATDPPHVTRPYSPGTKLTLAFLSIYMLVQIVVPLRHVAYAGDADWTEEGQQFAWRMLMREKRAVPPAFMVTYEKGGRKFGGAMPIPFPNDPAFWSNDWQFYKMVLDPDMVLQF